MARHTIEYISGYTHKVEDPYDDGRYVSIYIKVPRPDPDYGYITPCQGFYVFVRRSFDYVLMRFQDLEAVAEVFNLRWLPKEERKKLNEAHQETLRIYSEIVRRNESRRELG